MKKEILLKSISCITNNCNKLIKEISKNDKELQEIFLYNINKILEYNKNMIKYLINKEDENTVKEEIKIMTKSIKITKNMLKE